MRVLHLVVFALLLGGVAVSVAYGGGALARPMKPGAVVAINCPPPNPKATGTEVSDC